MGTFSLQSKQMNYHKGKNSCSKGEKPGCLSHMQAPIMLHVFKANLHVFSLWHQYRTSLGKNNEAHACTPQTTCLLFETVDLAIVVSVCFCVCGSATGYVYNRWWHLPDCSPYEPASCLPRCCLTAAVTSHVLAYILLCIKVRAASQKMRSKGPEWSVCRVTSGAVCVCALNHGVIPQPSDMVCLVIVDLICWCLSLRYFKHVKWKRRSGLLFFYFLTSIRKNTLYRVIAR